MRNAAYDTNKIALIGVPSSAGARHVGQEQAPRCLRDSGLVERLRSTGHEVLDLGDLDQVTFSPDSRHPKLQNLGAVVGVLRQVGSAVDVALAHRAWPLVVGGDCTITIGVLAALTRHFASLGMVYFDGDLDLNTPETTISGILDGMGLAHMLGRGEVALSGLGAHRPMLAERNVLLFGYSVEAGGIDPAELELLKHSEMARHPLEAVTDEMETGAAHAMLDLESRAEQILVHFDVDVVDADDLAAADVRHSPGLSLAQAQKALAVFVGSRRAAALVVTEFNAGRDTSGELARRLVDTITAAIGRCLRADSSTERVGR